MDILYGGTFDPPHLGHERFIELVLARFPDARLHLVPCWQPVHKARAQADPEQRLGMLQALCAPWRRVTIDQQELRAAEPVYTLETLQAWRAELGDRASLVFAMGGDSFAGLHQWSRWQQLTELAHILVLPRPGWKQDLPPEVAAHFQGRWLAPRDTETLARTPCGHAMELPGKALTCASSQIREGTAVLAHAVPERVLHYIRQERVYPSLEVQ
ncbi:nicotinate (nicotinamide) nucleotide adenylyltransferase [Natronospirillum operosum]|uniref:Probable nicotinate-nucleotide adenylyltransferase n=1 Tax=Natronospirillum operosum TaxID=2759953 RepID=A0A4Z0WCM3_9GAMM|nr:nicotinate (nicotinamide) nucleotide adenylyltransferase [Natronospirillum operosum]TGG92750.1 nicotinate (nicotinamide) nucleotide adenylyltransferase [Natronospirillum operosum]